MKHVNAAGEMIHPRHPRQVWRNLIMWAVSVREPCPAREIGQTISREVGEVTADTTCGAFYGALRSLVEDGSLLRTEYGNDGFRRNVTYQLSHDDCCEHCGLPRDHGFINECCVRMETWRERMGLE